MRQVDSPLARSLILDVLHVSPNLPSSEQATQMQDADWKYLLKMGRMHRLGPLLHNNMLRKGFSRAVPAEIRDVFLSMYKKHSLRNLAMYRELLTVVSILDARQVPSIALKGAFLAHFAYPELGLRPMRDIDLLVSPEHAIKAFNRLRDCGYRPAYDGLPEAHLENNKIHLPPLSSPGGILIELHYRLTFPELVGDRPDEFESGLWARSMTRPIANTQIRFLCAQDLLLHLCQHATVGHQFSLGPLALADIALLTEAEPINWEDFLRIASGTWRRCALAPLFLAKRHLGASIPDEIISTLGGGKDTAEWLDSAEYLLFSELDAHMLLNNNVQNILCSGNTMNKFSSLARTVFPPRSVISTHFPVRADSPMAFLYYPKNWQRLLKKKLPNLISGLVTRPREIEKLAFHKRAFNNWLQVGIQTRSRSTPKRPD
jgi:hypothetical protein